MSKPAQLDIVIQDWKRVHAQTVKLMEVAPDDKYDWKPHETSMNLGALLNHISQAESGMVEAMVSGLFPREFTSYDRTAQLIAAFNKSHEEALARVASISAAGWDEPISPFGPDRSFSRLSLLTLMLEHEIHHRGQLYVYLRMLDCPVPELFG